MSKVILKPGNGLNFPKKGDYTKVKIKTKVDSEAYNLVLRIGHSKNIISEIESVIKEMTLYEKCLLFVKSEEIEIELIGISYIPIE